MTRKNILFILICSICYEFILKLAFKLIKYKKLLYESQIEIYSDKQLEKILNIQNILDNLNILLTFIFIFIKTIIITCVIYCGVLFFCKKRIVFNQIWNLILKAEFIFLLVPFFKIIWFYFFQTNYNLEDIQNFYPFSAINISGWKNLESWLIYPLQILNLFELAYIIYLSYLVGKVTNTNTDNGFKIIMYSYVPTMLLWVCVVMFLTLSMS
jgi:hypothetical protein